MENDSCGPGNNFWSPPRDAFELPHQRDKFGWDNALTATCTRTALRWVTYTGKPLCSRGLRVSSVFP